MGVSEATKLIFFGAVIAVGVSLEDDSILVRIPRQTQGKNNQNDQSSAETGFLGGGGVENSKYFQEIYVHKPDPMEIEFGHVVETPHDWEQRYEKKDFNRNRHQGKVRRLQTWTTNLTNPSANSSGLRYQHLPEHDKYEFGHRRGNEHHVVERYEKAIPHDGQFKTKVRWADKKGGHGEHYWDYNHAGHGGHGGNGGQGDGDGGYSDPVPVYSNQQKPGKQHTKRESESDRKITLEDIEESEPKVNLDSLDRRDFVKSVEDEIGGVENFDYKKEAGKQKKNQEAPEASKLFFDVKSGVVVDEATGKKFILQPVN